MGSSLQGISFTLHIGIWFFVIIKYSYSSFNFNSSQIFDRYSLINKAQCLRVNLSHHWRTNWNSKMKLTVILHQIGDVGDKSEAWCRASSSCDYKHVNMAALGAWLNCDSCVTDSGRQVTRVQHLNTWALQLWAFKNDLCTRLTDSGNQGERNV